ncbi:MAG: CRTAC1 family protein [Candidatus Entotheonellia bacterium]
MLTRPLPASRGNRLFRNNGDGTFTDVTERAGVLALQSRGFTPCFADMNGDRFPELLLVADGGTSRYFVNTGDGTFTDATAASGTGQDHFGMGGVVADLNNDARLDWFVTSIFLYRKGAGNKLYLNQGQHRFTERAVAAGVRDAAFGWGTVAVDLDHDGWLDLVATTGYTRGLWQGRPSRLWINHGDGTFTDMAAAAGFDHRLGGRGLLHVDYDTDGDQDLVVTAHGQELRLYRNAVSGRSANWLRIFLETRGARTPAPNGVGSRVRGTVGERQQYRSIGGCAGYLSQSELSAHFGLGSAQRVDELRIEWANGSVTLMTHVPVNRTLTVQAPP